MMMSDDPLLSAARAEAEADQLQAAPLHRGLLSLLGTAARHWSRARQVLTNKKRETPLLKTGFVQTNQRAKKHETVVAISFILHYSFADRGCLSRIRIFTSRIQIFTSRIRIQGQKDSGSRIGS